MRSTAPRTRRLTGSCWTLASSCRLVSAPSQSESVKVRRSPAGTASAALILVPFGPNQTQATNVPCWNVRTSVPAPPAAAHRYEYRSGCVCGSDQVFVVSTGTVCRLMLFWTSSRRESRHGLALFSPVFSVLASPKVAGSIAPLQPWRVEVCTTAHIYRLMVVSWLLFQLCRICLISVHQRQSCPRAAEPLAVFKAISRLR